MKNLLLKIFHVDRWLNGLMAGLFVPIVILAALIILFESIGLISTTSKEQTLTILRPRTLALLALCLNIPIMQGFAKLRWNQSMRGMVIATFLCVVIWLIKYGKEIF